MEPVCLLLRFPEHVQWFLCSLRSWQTLNSSYNLSQIASPTVEFNGTAAPTGVKLVERWEHLQVLVLDYVQSLRAMAQDIQNTALEATEIELWKLRNMLGNWGVPLSFLPEHLAILEPVIYIGAAIAVVMAAFYILRRCTRHGTL